MYRTQHPMARYSKPRRSGVGCIIFVLVIGLIGGGVFFIWESRPSLKTRRANEAIAMLETSSAMLAGTPISTSEFPSATPSLYPTPDLSQEPTNRQIIFPQAGTVGRIVTAPRVAGSWDVTYLQDLVGHLEGTSWLGESGNTVLAGHFEDQLGKPGPFRYLYNAQIGDRIIIQEGEGENVQVIYYEVVEVFRTEPEDIEILRNTINPRLTLITCDDWNQTNFTYDERLVVVAEPIDTVSTN